jgi:hypothetical protein
MVNRISPRISGLPKRYHRDLISFLQSQQKFKTLQTKIHLNSPDGGKSCKPGSISASMMLTYFHYVYRYKGYSVTVLAILGEVYITCEKL